MGVQRFMLDAVNVALLQQQVEPGLTVSAMSTPMYLDVTLTDDALLPDLQAAMLEQGWVFVASAPTTGLPTITSTDVEVDFGTVPTTDAQFAVVSATALPTSKCTATLSGKTATGRTDGDAQWDAITFGVNPGTGSITLYANCPSGSVVGKRVVTLTVSNI
jgi:hypothetical protein